MKNRFIAFFSIVRSRMNVSKASIMLLAFILLFSMPGVAVAQNATIKQKIDLKLENASLVNAFDKIEEALSISIIYSQDDIDNQRVYNKTYNQQSAESILKDLLSSTNLTYEAFNKSVSIIKKETKQASQVVSVNGVILDESGAPIVGAAVLSLTTNRGATTDSDGKYHISGISSSDVLEFSYIGCTTVNQQVGSRSTIDVVLNSSSVELEDVVVVGYGTQKKVNVTGSVANVKGDAIVDIPAATITNSLAGRLPGVIFTQGSGEPGNDNASISIRGFDSPLVIVDGVEADFSRLDPNDIQDISILKDASAAIYGARAGNGVVLVTTKRGALNEKTRVSISSSYGWQGSTVVPDYADAEQYMELVNDYAPGSYLDEDFAAYQNGTKTSTNWYGETFRKYAPIFKTNANISGGSEKTSYYLSFGYLNQESLLQSGDTNYDQYNVRSNVTTAISETLSVTMDLSYRNELRSYPGYNMENIMTNVAFSNPTYPATYPDSSYPVYNGFNMGPNYLSQREVTGYNDSESTNTSGNFAINWTSSMIEGLSAKAFMNFTSWGQRSKAMSKEFSYYTYDPTSGTYGEVIVNDISNIGITESYNRSSTTTANFSVNYNKEFGKHKIDALVLNEIISSKGDYIEAGRSDFISSVVEQLFASSADKQLTNGWAWQDARLSFVGRINYNYDDKYLAEFTFREDASPRFAKEERWGFFPSASFGWRVTQEEFLKNNDVLTNLKLRLSCGQSGNDNIVSYNFLTGYNFGWPYVLDDSIATTVTTKGLANPNATWETMTMYNVGVDYDLWGRKLWGEVDVFYRLREGMLARRNASLPSTFGAELPFENINSQSSRGFEVVVGHDNTIGDLTYSISGNLSFARAKWEHYDEPMYEDEQSKARYQMSGQWVNRYFGYKSMGLFTSEEEIAAWADQDGDKSNGVNTDLKPGDVKYYDLNHDGLITELDKYAIGKNNMPETYFGLNASAKYKGFDFSMLWQGATGFNVVYAYEAQQPFYNNAMPLSMFMDRWTPENNDADARFPRTVSNSGSTNNYRESTFWLQDGTYLRLKNITLGYTLPKSAVEKLNMESVRFTISGLNLLTFTGVYPYDPETLSGGRGWDYPQQKTIMLGANIGF